MYKIGDYVVYRKDTCKIIDIKEKYFNDTDYYVLVPMDDESLKLQVPVTNPEGYLRSLISKEQLEQLLLEIPKIDIVDQPVRLMENEYKLLMRSGKLEDLIKIIKTTYHRNKEREACNKKTSDKDNQYFEQAEKCLYNEFRIVLGMSYEETKQFVIDRVEQFEKQ